MRLYPYNLLYLQFTNYLHANNLSKKSTGTINVNYTQRKNNRNDQDQHDLLK